MNFGTPNKGREKHKHYNISYRKKFYPKLYELATLVLGVIRPKTKYFPRLPKAQNSSTAVHVIGKETASLHKPYTRGDVHRMGRDVGFLDLIECPAYEKNNNAIDQGSVCKIRPQGREKKTK